MSFPLINPSHQFFDTSGAPLVSGTIEFQNPTTAAKINTYPTADNADAQTNANANPLTLDSRGGYTGIYLEDGVKYKVIIKDSSGTTVDTQDDVLSPISLPYLQTAAESNASITPINLEYPPGNILRYGTNTTPGTTDMTTALQNAIDSFTVWTYTNPSQTTGTVGGGTVKIPIGKYLITSAITYTGAITIQGEGNGSWLACTMSAGIGVFNPDTANYTKGTLIQRPAFKDFRITSSDGNGLALNLIDSGQITVSNLTIYNFEVGIRIGHSASTDETYYNKIDHCSIYDNIINIDLLSGASGTTLVGNYIWHANDYALASYNIIDASSSTMMFGNAIEGRPSIAQVWSKGRDLVWIGSYTETRNTPTVDFVPTLKRTMSNANDEEGNIFVGGLKNFSLLLDGWPYAASDDSSSAASRRRPMTVIEGTPVFVDCFGNGNFDRGLYKVSQIAAGGTFPYETTTKWWSVGSIKMVKDATGTKNTITTNTGTFDWTNYIGLRVWVGVLVKKEGTSTITAKLRGAGNTQTRTTSNLKPSVDFGDGWFLYVIDTPILSNAALIVDVEQDGANNDIIYVGGVQCFTNGFEYFPSYRPTTVLETALPSSGTWVAGDYITNSPTGVSGSGGYVTANQKYWIAGWLRITSGTGNVLDTDWVQDRRLTGQ